MTPEEQERQENKARGKHLALDGEVKIFVEANDDMIFWREIFWHFAPELKIKIHKSGEGMPISGSDLLEKRLDREGVNQYKIICFDSDYKRYWSKNSRYESLYIFQTFSHSIENHNCFPAFLDRLVRIVTETENIQPWFSEFLKKYSQTVYPLFVYFVYDKLNNKNILTDKDFHRAIFTQEFFQKNIASKITENDIIKNIEAKVNALIAELTLKEKISDNDWQNTCEYLQNNYSIDNDNTYMYIRGHNLEETVITTLLGRLCYDLIKDKLNEYDNIIKVETSNNTKRIKQAEDNKKKYLNNLGAKEKQDLMPATYYKITTLLKNNFTNCLPNTDCHLMQKIGNQVRLLAIKHQEIQEPTEKR